MRRKNGKMAIGVYNETAAIIKVSFQSLEGKMKRT